MVSWQRSLITLLLVGLVVPGAGLGAEQSPPGETSASVTVGGDKVNINTADVKELMTLNGVGRRVAEKIVEYRQAHGTFKKPEELRKVDGIGAALWERNRERVVVK